MNNILILGGTGAMGISLVRILASDYTLYVTTRSNRKSDGNINYIQGNALNVEFLRSVLKQHHWTAIVDFMVRSQDNLKEVLTDILDSTDQYVFISSARVYSESDSLISEKTPRLLDVSDDVEYLQTNEYALAKAREENLLSQSGRDNYTIIRPSITYNDYRLQLGAFEKEQWLYRALKGRTIVFSEDLANKITTMTHGDDVAAGIASIIGKPRALGETYHITSPIALTWRDVLDVYMDTIEDCTGHRPKIVYTSESTIYYDKGQKWRMKYCRLFNRVFDNSKISEFIDINDFINPKEGLRRCLKNFIDSPRFLPLDIQLEAIHDRIVGEHTPLAEISDKKSRIIYYLYRHKMTFVVKIYSFCLKLFR